MNVFGGLGIRTNESHGHLIWGIKAELPAGFTLGIQDDGHKRHPFVTASRGQWIAGLYLIGGKTPAPMIGLRF